MRLESFNLLTTTTTTVITTTTTTIIIIIIIVLVITEALGTLKQALDQNLQLLSGHPSVL